MISSLSFPQRMIKTRVSEGHAILTLSHAETPSLRYRGRSFREMRKREIFDLARRMAFDDSVSPPHRTIQASSLQGIPIEIRTVERDHLQIEYRRQLIVVRACDRTEIGRITFH
ncbi:hypothetical protein GWI33_018862 [Rhynchophorus ferrugineus]|uniref:Uncharacterized protein n=1 Tax=Rhynchophorus ferrugineus TaxID=354439 RepID=A0A834HSK1_RHYFE|nr:hypothetical protein GWI33_018862 [Rhynchophorus ferrugineus]